MRLNSLTKDWTESVALSAQHSADKGQYVRSRAKLVVLGSVATLKDSVMHSVAAVSVLAVSVLRGVGGLSLISAGKLDKKVEAYTAANAGFHTKKAVLHLLNVIPTIVLGLLFPKTQLKLLAKQDLFFVVSPEVKAKKEALIASIKESQYVQKTSEDCAFRFGGKTPEYTRCDAPMERPVVRAAFESFIQRGGPIAANATPSQKHMLRKLARQVAEANFDPKQVATDAAVFFKGVSA